MNKFKTGVLLSYISIASVSAAIITPALPTIEKEFSLGYGTLEWVVTIFLLGYVFGQLIYGPIANRFGRLAAMRGGLTLNLVGIFICLFSTLINSFGLLLVGRGISALGAACGLTCTFILVYELLDQERAKQALAYAVVSFSLGVGIAITLGGIITQYWAWPAIFWVLLLHGTLMLWSTWLFKEPLKEKQSLHIGHLIKGYGHVLRNPFLIIFSLILGMTAVMNYCYSTAAPNIAHSLLKLSPSEYGYWNLINMVGMFGSGFFGQKLLKRYKAISVIHCSLFFLLLCFVSYAFLLFTHIESALWFFITSTFAYFFSGLLFPCGSHYAMCSVVDKGSGSSMMNFINMGIASISVLIMGYLPFSSLGGFIAILAFFWALIVLLLFVIRRKELKV